jgi:hypothetical protein
MTKATIALATTVAAVLAPAAALGSDPSVGLRPGGSAPDIRLATAIAEPDSIHVELAWARVQRRPGAFDWSLYSGNYTGFQRLGLSIGSVRVTEPPHWAVAGNRCRSKYKECPPARAHYDDFRKFVQEAVERFGPGTRSDIRRFVLWSEPNLASKWGGKGIRQGAPEEYSDLLAHFHRAATRGNRSVAVDAGELAAGDTVPGTWAKKFTAYNTRKRRNGNYQVLNIHAYSKSGRDVVQKINQYRRFPGVGGVSVTEFGWAVGAPNPRTPEARFKCTTTSGQDKKFRQTVAQVRERTKGVRALVWVGAADRPRSKDLKCLDNTGYYKGAVRRSMETYGLYKRTPSGSLVNMFPRPVATSFRQAAR